MQCSKCGTENAETSRFCVLCGQEFMLPNKVLPQQQSLAVTENKSDSDKKESVYVAINNEEYQQIVTSDAQIISPKNRIPRWLILTIMSTILLILAILTYICYPKLKMAIIGPEKYYVMSERKYIEEKFSMFEKYIKAGVDMPFNLDFVSRFSADNIDEKEYPKIADFLNHSELRLTMNHDVDNNKFFDELLWKYEEDARFHLLLQEDDGRMSVSFPNMERHQLVSNSIRGYANVLIKDEIELQKMTGLMQNEFDKLLSQVFERVVVNSIPKDNIQKSTQEYHGIRCDTVTFIINQSVLSSCYQAFAKELENNADLQNAVKKMIQYHHEYRYPYDKKGIQVSQTLSQDEIDEAYNDIIEYCKRKAENEKLDSNRYITAFYNNRGKLIAREIAKEDKTARVLIGEFTNTEAKCFEVILEDENTITTILDTKTVSNAVVTGNVTMQTESAEEENKSVVSIVYSYEENAKLDGIPVFVGKVKIESNKLPNQEGNEIPFTFTFENQKATNDTMNVTASLRFTKDNQTATIGMQGLLKMTSFPNAMEITIPNENTMTNQDMKQIKQRIENSIIKEFGLERFFKDFFRFDIPYIK